MAIRATQFPSSIQGAVGLFQALSVRFVSDDPLTGKTVYFNPSLWEQFISDPVVNSIPTEGYSLEYPNTPGTYEMNLLSGIEYKNYKANIEVVDNKEFIITLEFLWTVDINGALGVSTVSNDDRFSEEGVASSHVYDATKYLRFQVVDSDLNYVNKSITSSGNYFCEDDFEYQFYINDIPATGFSPSGNLKIEGIVPFTGLLSNEYYALLYRENAIAPLESYIEDLNLKYARISGVVEQVSDLDETVFTNVTALQNDGTFELEITPDAFDNSEYRFAIVYRDGVNWKVCKTGIFGLNDNEYQVAVPDFTCQVCEYHGETYDACCVSNVSACERLNICQTIDKASYDAAAASVGHGGTFSNNLKAITVYYADSPTQLAPSPDQTIDDVTITENASDYNICATFRVPESYLGSRLYFIVRLEFEIPASPSYVDYVYQVTTINVTDNTAQLDNITFLNGEGGDAVATDYVCLSEEVLRLEFDNNSGYDLRVIPVLQVDEEFNRFGDTCMPGLQSDLIITVDDSVSNGQTGFVEFDLSKFTQGTEYCVKLLTRRTDITLTCDCDDPMDSITMLVYQFDCEDINAPGYYDTEFHYYIGAWLGQVASLDLEIYDAKTGKPVLGTTNFNSEQGQVTFYNDIPFDRALRYVMNVELTNGCTYSIVFELVRDQSRIVEAGGSCTPPSMGSWDRIDICDNLSGRPAPTCENFPSIEASECAGGQVYGDAGGTIASGILSDVWASSEDGTIWVPYTPTTLIDAPIFFRRTLVYDDGCPGDVVHQYVTCDENPVCDNAPTLDLNWDEPSELLTFSIGGILTSGFTVVFDCSTNGGTSFSACGASPTSTSGLDEIIFRATITYTDDCPQETIYGIWFRSQCDFSDYQLSCVWANGVTTPTFVEGDKTLTTNLKEYSTDGGATWFVWPGGTVAGDLTIFRWTIEADGCDRFCLVTACADDCCDQDPQCCESYCCGVCKPEDPRYDCGDGAGAVDDLEICDA